jgi:hypothetical protein
MEVTKDELVAALKSLSMAKVIYQSFGMMNTFGRSTEERVDMDVEYQIARENVSRKQVIYDDLFSRYTGEL